MCKYCERRRQRVALSLPQRPLSIARTPTERQDIAQPEPECHGNGRQPQKLSAHRLLAAAVDDLSEAEDACQVPVAKDRDNVRNWLRVRDDSFLYDRYEIVPASLCFDVQGGPRLASDLAASLSGPHDPPKRPLLISWVADLQAPSASVGHCRSPSCLFGLTNR